MPNVAYDFWEGCNVHGLKRVEEFTSLSRIEFKQYCEDTINDYVKQAVELGADEVTARKKITRSISDEYFFFFCIAVLGLDYIDHDFGYRLCMSIQYDKWHKLWVIAREHYKSTLITCASTLWELCKDPNRTYCIYSYTVDMAKEKFLGMIKKWIETNDLLRYLYDDVFWSDPSKGYEILPNGKRITWSWTNKALEFKRTINSKEKTIEVGGIHGSSKTGGHFSHQIFDDCETFDNVTTPYSIETLYNEILMATNTGQTANMNICFVGTFYAKEDAYTRMIKEHVIDEAVVQSCYDENGESIHYSQKDLEVKRRKMGSLTIWSTQMLCDPSLSNQSSFVNEWVQFWRPWNAENFNNLNIYTIVDPSSGRTSKKHDYTAVVTVGIGYGETIMILDMFKDKITLEGKFKILVEQYVKYHPEHVFYEEVGMQSDIESLQREMERTNTYFPILKFSPIKWGEKSARIEKVQFEFKNRRIWLPEHCYHDTAVGDRVDMTGFFLSSEYSGYPHIMHDDMLDCISHVIHLLRSGQIQAPTIHNSIHDVRLRGCKQDVEDASWEPMDYALEA